MIGAAVANLDFSGLDVIQVFTQNTKDLSINWTPELIIEAKKKTKRIYSHAMFKIVLDKPYTKRLLSEHYIYLCNNKIDGYVVHIPAAITINECVKYIQSILRRIKQVTTNYYTTIYFEHIPSEIYSISANMYLLASILSAENEIPLGICIDTCHIYVSGINIADENIMAKYLHDLQIKSLANIKLLVHLNDSINDLGSFIDRHAHIGNKIWAENLDSLRYLLNNIGDADIIIELSDYKDSLATLLSLRS